MKLDLARLREMHNRLPADLTLIMMGRAALALERNGHAPGAPISLSFPEQKVRGELSWAAADLGAIDQHDKKRITEDGAEAIALVIAHQYRAWRVIRRLQQGESGDWLLEDCRQQPPQEVSLEVSGVDRGGIGDCLRRKLRQVAKSIDVDQRWAGVVGFQNPAAALHEVKSRRRGH